MSEALRRAIRRNEALLHRARAARRAARSLVVPWPRALVLAAAGGGEAVAGLARYALGAVWRKPLMRARCASLGRGLHLDGPPPQILGSGRIEIGDDVVLGAPLTFDLATPLEETAELVIGSRVSINYRTLITAYRSVRIGDDTMIAGEVAIFDNTSHPIEPARRHEPVGPDEITPVVIGRNVWIGMRSIILRGVTIGDNAVVAAGSVVTKPVPANCIVGGNPARVLKSFEPDDRA